MEGQDNVVFPNQTMDLKYNFDRKCWFPVGGKGLKEENEKWAEMSKQ